MPDMLQSQSIKVTHGSIGEDQATITADAAITTHVSEKHPINTMVVKLGASVSDAVAASDGTEANPDYLFDWNPHDATAVTDTGVIVMQRGARIGVNGYTYSTIGIVETPGDEYYSAIYPIGSPTGGTFKLSYGGVKTAAISGDTTIAATFVAGLKAAILAHPALSGVTVQETVSVNGVIIIFDGIANPTAITVTDSELIGGDTPSIVATGLTHTGRSYGRGAPGGKTFGFSYGGTLYPYKDSDGNVLSEFSAYDINSGFNIPTFQCADWWPGFSADRVQKSQAAWGLRVSPTGMTLDKDDLFVGVHISDVMNAIEKGVYVGLMVDLSLTNDPLAGIEWSDVETWGLRIAGVRKNYICGLSDPVDYSSRHGNQFNAVGPITYADCAVLTVDSGTGSDKAFDVRVANVVKLEVDATGRVIIGASASAGGSALYLYASDSTSALKKLTVNNANQITVGDA